MPGQVQVESIDSLRRLRAQVAKFAEVVSSAVSEASAEVQKTLNWLELTQTHKWKLELRNRHNRLQQALEALRMKQLYRGPAGERQSYVDEERHARKCKAAMEEAELKLKLIAQHRNRLSREAVLFQGILQRIGTIAHQDAPAALAELQLMIAALERYATPGGLEVGSGAGGLGPVSGAYSVPAMARPETQSAGAPGGASAEGEAAEVTDRQWEQFSRRARDYLLRFPGAVVVEAEAVAACMPGPEGVVPPATAPLAAWKDGFTGRIFVGFVAASAPAVLPAPVEATATSEPGLTPVVGLPVEAVTREDFLAAWPLIEQTLVQPGDRRVLLSRV